MNIINITTINESYYFIQNKVIRPNSTDSVDADTLVYTEIRDLINAELNHRILLSQEDKSILNELIIQKDGKLSEDDLKTINGESLIGSGDIIVDDSSQAVSDFESSCHISGGDITIIGGNTFNISEGIGYARNPNDELVRITWNNQLGMQTSYNGENYIGFDYNSQIVFSTQPLSSAYCPIGYIFTINNNAVIIGSANSRLTGKNSLYRLGDLFRTTIGSLVQSGVSTAMKTAPNDLELTISQGIVWHLLDKVEISETSNFTKLYNSTNNFQIDSTNINKVDNVRYNIRTNPANTALVNMTDGFYKKDIIVVTPSNRAYYLYGTSEWATEDEAKIAPSPLVPESIKYSVIRSAALIIQKNASTPSTILDIRPMFTKLFETGTAASNATIISHGDLIDLNSDDHSIYHTDARGDARYYRKNEVDTFLNNKSNLLHSHDIVTTTSAGYISSSDKIKLDSIESNATHNNTDNYLLSRTNHTGTQTSGTISDFNLAVESLINNRIETNIIETNDIDAPSQSAVFQALSSKANVNHTHSIQDVLNLQSSLDAKSNSTHIHTSSSITDFITASRSAVVEDTIVDGITNKAPSQNAVYDALSLKSNNIHNHTISQLTDYAVETDSRIANYIATTSIDSLSDVDTTGKSDGQSLVYNSTTNQWKPTTLTTYGDMYKSIYDVNNNGVIDNSEKLNNQLPSYYLNRSNHTGTQDISTITGLTKNSIGLGNVDNTSDVNKPVSSATQSALNSKENSLGFGSTTDYFAGDKTFKPLVTNNVAESTDKRYVTDLQKTSLQNISGINTGDETVNTIKTKLGVASTIQDGYLTSVNFNIFNNKEPSLPTGTSTQYFKGDKTLGTLDKTSVGLNNVQNIDTSNAANISSGILPLARLPSNLQKLSDSIYSNGTLITYSNDDFNSTSLISSKNTVTIDLTTNTLDINAKYGNHPNNPYFSFMEHFVGTVVSSTLSPYFARTVNSGTTATVLPTIGDDRLGVVSLSTGTISTGGTALSTSSIFSIIFSNLEIGGYFETGCSFKLPVLSTSTETFALIFGFGDNTLGVPIDGAYIYYTTSGVTARTVSNSIVTSQSFTGLSNLVANDLYNCKIRVTKTGSSTYIAEFNINGFLATITTGLPLTVGRETSLQYSILKSVGATSRLVELDWIYFERYNPITLNY